AVAAYPDAAWAAGIEGDVVVETCPAPAPLRVLEGPPALASAALDVLRGSEPARCATIRFAFRRHLTPADVLALTGGEAGVLVTRGLERARKLRCDPTPSYSSAGMVEGSSRARLTIDEQGRVVDLTWLKAVGSPAEAALAGWLRSCAFAPATLDGK